MRNTAIALLILLSFSFTGKAQGDSIKSKPITYKDLLLVRRAMRRPVVTITNSVPVTIDSFAVTLDYAIKKERVRELMVAAYSLGMDADWYNRSLIFTDNEPTLMGKKRKDRAEEDFRKINLLVEAILK